jgi:hypothetical protein
MSINFEELLSPEQKYALIEGKIQQLAIEGYQLQINKLAVNKLENASDAVASIDANLEVITKAIEAYQAELAKLQ